MSEMVERAAIAIVDFINAQDGYGTHWEDASDDAKQDMCKMARAVIEAMRKPTEAMILNSTTKSCLSIWQSMIDEALK